MKRQRLFHLTCNPIQSGDGMLVNTVRELYLTKFSLRRLTIYWYTSSCYSLFPKNALSTVSLNPGVPRTTNLEGKPQLVKNLIPLRGEDAALLDNPSSRLPQEVYCSSCHLTDCSASLA